MKSFTRRGFLKTTAVGTAAIAVLPSFAQSARAEGDLANQFTFIAAAKAAGGMDVVLLDGGGFWGGGDVKGQGGFTHFSSFPTSVIAFGRWKAKKFVGFTPAGSRGDHFGGSSDSAPTSRRPAESKLRMCW